MNITKKDGCRTAKKFTVLLVVLLLHSCNKKPPADFSADKTRVCSALQPLRLTNNSTDDERHKCTFPNIQISKARNVNYTHREKAVAGTYKIKFEVFSRRWDSSSETSKTNFGKSQRQIHGLGQLFTRQIYSRD